MFYVRQESGETHYFSPDNIRYIHAIPKIKETNEEDILQKLSETIERFKSTDMIQAEDGCNIIEALMFIIKGGEQG